MNQTNITDETKYDYRYFDDTEADPDPDPKEHSQGDLINLLVNLRKQMREHEATLSSLESQFKIFKLQLIEKLKNAGSLSGKTALGTATLTSKTVPNLADRDAFWDYVFKTQDPALVSHARPATKAILELYEMGIPVPGTELITLEDISLRIS